jgi:hypothetical protein
MTGVQNSVLKYNICFKYKYKYEFRVIITLQSEQEVLYTFGMK